MKKRRFDLFLVFIALAALALLGMAVWYAILRPDSNYRPQILPDHGIPDCLCSIFYLLLTAFVCFVGGLRYKRPAL